MIIGYDSGKQQKDAIRDGTMAGAITQNPVGIGYKTVEAAVKALKGEKLPKVIDTGFYWYDKTNIDDPRSRPFCTTDPSLHAGGGVRLRLAMRLCRPLRVKFQESRP